MQGVAIEIGVLEQAVRSRSIKYTRLDSSERKRCVVRKPKRTCVHCTRGYARALSYTVNDSISRAMTCGLRVHIQGPAKYQTLSYITRMHGTGAIPSYHRKGDEVLALEMNEHKHKAKVQHISEHNGGCA